MILYVSCGGSGGHEALTKAALLADDQQCPIGYLGVIDDDVFGDVGESTMRTIVEELDFLFRTQLVAVLRQIEPGLERRVFIRHGDYREAIVAVATAEEATTVLIGAPVRRSAEITSDLVAHLADELSCEIIAA